MNECATLSGMAERLRMIARHCRGCGQTEDAILSEIDAIAEGIDGLASRRSLLAPMEGEARTRHLQRCLGLRTPRAARMLLYLAERPGRLCGYDAIEAAVDSPRNALNVYACYARSALVRQGLDEPLITEVGRGYRLSFIAAERVQALFDAEARL